MARSILRQRESWYGGWGEGGGSMVVVGKSESCYLLCGWLGSDLKGVFSVFLQGVGDTSDSESWFAEGEGPSWVFVELEILFSILWTASSSQVQS